MQVGAEPEILPNEIRLPDRASHQAELDHPSKLRKLEDGTSTPGIVNNSPAVYSAPSQVVVPTGPSGSYSSGAVHFQQPENEAPQVIASEFQFHFPAFLLFYYTLHSWMLVKYLQNLT